MIYVVIFVLSVLALLNLYASWKVLRDDFSTGTQKLMQLGFVWLLPVFGAVLAVSLISGTRGTRHPSIDFDMKKMDVEDYWHYGLEGCDHSTHSSSDHSCN